MSSFNALYVLNGLHTFVLFQCDVLDFQLALNTCCENVHLVLVDTMCYMWREMVNVDGFHSDALASPYFHDPIRLLLKQI